MTNSFKPPAHVNQPLQTARVAGEITLIVIVTLAMFFGLFFALRLIVLGQHPIFALMLFLFAVPIVPPAMEDLGVLLAHRLQMYHIGGALLWGTYQCDRMQLQLEKFSREGRHVRSMGAMRLAQLSLLQNDLSEAVVWAQKAVAMSARDAWFGKFYAHSVLGQVYYAIGEHTAAREQLEIAENLFETNGTLLKVLLDKMTKFSVVNRDLLGRICLISGAEPRAAELFHSSYVSRLSIKTLAPMAEAFKEYSQGLTALQFAQTEKAQEHFSRALSLIPEKVSNDYEQRMLAIDICSAATTCGAPSDEIALLACEKLEQQYQRGLHPRLLESAAKPIPLPGQKPRSSNANADEG